MFRSTPWPRAIVLAILLTLVSLPSFAADFGFKGIEVRGGVILPDDWDTGYTVGASVNIGEIIDNLYLLPGAFYGTTEVSESRSFSIGPGIPTINTSTTLELTYFALGAEVRYYFDDSDRGWYAGGGPYLHLLDYEVLARVGSSFARATTDSSSVGLVAVGGYQITSNFAVEARYNTVSIAGGPQILASFSF